MVSQIAIFLHILAAVTWVGGMLFLVMVLVPLVRQERQAGRNVEPLLRSSANKFLPVAWTSMAILALTGAFIAWTEWGVRPDSFFTTGGHFYRTLQVKTGLFILVMVLSLFHDFFLGPRVLDQMEKAAETDSGRPPSSSRRLLLTFARLNLLLVLVILFLAVVLIRP